MSYTTRLIHDLTLVNPRRDSGLGLDDYGHAEVGLPEETAVRGLVQPKDAREIALMSQAGAEISDHTVFLSPMDIPTGAWIRDADGNRLDIRGVRRFAYGHSPHLEVDAQMITSDEDEAS